MQVGFIITFDIFSTGMETKRKLSILLPAWHRFKGYPNKSRESMID